MLSSKGTFPSGQRLTKWIATLAIVAALSLGTKAVASSNADVILPGVGLDTLLGGGSIQVGDKLFANFSISGFDAAGVLVVGIQENGHYGVRLQGDFKACGNEVKDILIGFSVTALDPVQVIQGVQLDIEVCNSTGGGFASVVETAATPGGEQMLVPPLAVLDPPPVLSAYADLVSPQSKIFVLKNVVLVGGGDASPHKRLGTEDGALNCIKISQIDQLFVQIPEPGTVVLVAAGLLGVALTGRRRK